MSFAPTVQSWYREARRSKKHHSMGDVEEIKGRIEALSAEEQAELLAWLVERDHANWDAQIERDQKSGKLDALIAEAKADRAAGKARDL
jgi:flagellar motility protein MotE (MotC chaperone)